MTQGDEMDNREAVARQPFMNKEQAARIEAVLALAGFTVDAKPIDPQQPDGAWQIWSTHRQKGYASRAEMPDEWNAAIERKIADLAKRRERLAQSPGRERGIEMQAQDRSMAVVDTGCVLSRPLPASRDAAFIARQVRLVNEGAATRLTDLQRAYDGLAHLLDGILDGAKNRQLTSLDQAAGRLARAHDVAQQMRAVYAAIIDPTAGPADSMPERTEADAWSDILLGYNVPEEGERIDAWHFIDIIRRLKSLHKAMTHRPTTVTPYVEAQIALLEAALPPGTKPGHLVVAPRRLTWGELS